MDGFPSAVSETAEVGTTPALALDGFSGPLARLLVLARAHQVDLARLPMLELLDQLTPALQQPAANTPLGRKADWVVMAAWLLLLRSQLILPDEAPARQAASAEANGWRAQMLGLGEMQGLAAWLERRPQLGRDVFARGQFDAVAAAFCDPAGIDVIEFLWASLALFDNDLPPPDTRPGDRPAWRDLHSIPDARARILRLLREAPEAMKLEELLPEKANEEEKKSRRVALRVRSGWTSTFVAGLELAKQGEVAMEQEDVFGSTINVRSLAVEGPCLWGAPSDS